VNESREKPRVMVEFNPDRFDFCPKCQTPVKDHKPGEYPACLKELTDEIEVELRAKQ